MQKAMKKTSRMKQHNVRLNMEETKRAKKLQGHFDVGFASLVRMLMKEKEREIFP